MLIPDPVQDVIYTHLCTLYCIEVFFLAGGEFIMCVLIFALERISLEKKSWRVKNNQPNNAAKKSKMNISFGIWPCFFFLVIYLFVIFVTRGFNLRRLTAELVFEWVKEV